MTFAPNQWLVNDFQNEKWPLKRFSDGRFAFDALLTLHILYSSAQSAFAIHHYFNLHPASGNNGILQFT